LYGGASNSSSERDHSRLQRTLIKTIKLTRSTSDNLLFLTIEGREIEEVFVLH